MIARERITLRASRATTIGYSHREVYRTLHGKAYDERKIQFPYRIARYNRRMCVRKLLQRRRSRLVASFSFFSVKARYSTL